jgi:hypothetical protein
VVGPLPSTGCMVSQQFIARGSRSYLECWAVTSGPLYPGYITLTVALNSSVERVAGAGHSMVGRTSTHVVLWPPPWDSVARLRG